MNDSTELDTALPAQPQRRDLLGHACFYFHVAVMLYIVAGWALPWKPLLIVFLVFVPGVFLQWRVNQDTCILNNIEGWLRTRRWRNRHVNPEEGAWLLTLVRNVTGLQVTAFQIDLLTNAVLLLVWLLALAHLTGHL